MNVNKVWDMYSISSEAFYVIPDYPNYFISDKGNIKSKLTGQFIKAKTAEVSNATVQRLAERRRAQVSSKRESGHHLDGWKI
jgi:hypothetical protein